MTISNGGERFDLVISGASFAGLALANALGQAFDGELRIVLVDPAAPPSSSPDSRASNVSLSSKRLLEALGVWPVIAGQAQAVVQIEITDSGLEAGIRPIFLTYDNRIGGEPASYIVPNQPLKAALWERAVNTRGVELRTARASGLLLEESRAVLTLGDGEHLSAALVVAADGGGSRMRDEAGIKIVAWGGRQSGIVVTIAHERPHGGVAVQHFLPAGPFAILPLIGNRSCVTWSEKRETAGALMALDDEMFLAEVEHRFGGRLGALSLAGPRQSWPLEMHLARRYVADRLVLIGDAAHGVHPIAGQGLNLALRDVAALAEALADAARLGLDIGSAEPLERYEQWRRFDSTVSAFGFDGLNRLFSSDGTLSRAMRSFGLGIVDRMTGVKARLVSEGAGLSGELPRLLRGVPL